MRGPSDSSSTPSSSFLTPTPPAYESSRGSINGPLIAASQQYEVHSAESTVNGVLIGLLSSFGSAILIALIVVVVYFFKYTAGGRILLDRIGRPGEYDDEQAFLREEAEALEHMDDLQRMEYLRAKGRLEKYYTQEKWVVKA